MLKVLREHPAWSGIVGAVIAAGIAYWIYQGQLKEARRQTGLMEAQLQASEKAHTEQMELLREQLAFAKRTAVEQVKAAERRQQSAERELELERLRSKNLEASLSAEGARQETLTLERIVAEQRTDSTRAEPRKSAEDWRLLIEGVVAAAPHCLSCKTECVSAVAGPKLDDERWRHASVCAKACEQRFGTTADLNSRSAACTVSPQVEGPMERAKQVRSAINATSNTEKCVERCEIRFPTDNADKVFDNLFKWSQCDSTCRARFASRN